MNEEEQDQTISSIPRRRRSAVLVVVAIFAIMSFFVYQAPFGGTLVSRMASVVPYPLIKVNGAWISYDYALQRRDGLKSYYETQSIEMSDQVDFQQKLLQSLVHELLIRQLMKDHQVYLGDDAVMDLMSDLEKQSGSRDELVSDIEDVYGWNLKKFEKHVAKPFVEAQALESAFLQDPELQKTKRDLIEEASLRIDDGETFDAMVLEYSEDGTTVYNGDFGWFYEQELPTVWFGPATHMSVGDISPVLDGRDRFTILRLDAKNERGDETRYNLSAIVVNKLTLTEIVEKYAEESEVKIFVRVE